MEKIIEILFISLAVSAASMTLTKASIFNFLREGIKKRNKWLGELISCPYCTSHYLAGLLIIVYQPTIMAYIKEPVVSFLVIWLTIVSLDTFSSGLIYKAISQMDD